LQTLSTLFQSFRRWYFRARSFEKWNGGVIYEYLGIRIYKKYLPTSGDLITQAQGIKRLKIKETGRRTALEDHRKLTCTWEMRHLISAALLQTWAVFGGLSLGAEHFWISSAINMIVNGYPIMLQRFNRIRIDACLEKMQPNK
jgi:hypothetical protein